jgi:hypothetical protein
MSLTWKVAITLVVFVVSIVVGYVRRKRKEGSHDLSFLD